jgi:N-hydroxyarylamine O-acetyltransferase
VDNAVLPAPAGSRPEWGADQLELEPYFARIGYHGPTTPTLETLRAIHRAHATTVTWEIIDMTCGRGVDLSLPALRDKIVRDGRGGCCLETNLLFAAALDQLGFSVVRHISRVRRGSNQIRTRSHVVLLVEVEGELWMADPGFGDESILEPIRFEDGATLTVGDWTWRLDDEDGTWVLRSLHANGWFDVYSFRLEEHHPIDFDMINYFSYADPNSVFIGKLVIQRGDEKVRQVLKENILTTAHPDGTVETRELTGAEIVAEIRDTFNLKIDEADQKLLQERYSA